MNSEFSFSTSCFTEAEELSLSYYLPIAGERIIGFIPFPRVLVLREMQLVWSKIWTRIVVSIYYDDNHYTTGTSKQMIITFKLVWFGFLFDSISTFMGYLIPKPSFVEEQKWYNLTISRENTSVHTFPKGISEKVTGIVTLDFELTYYDVAL